MSESASNQSFVIRSRGDESVGRAEEGGGESSSVGWEGRAGGGGAFGVSPTSVGSAARVQAGRSTTIEAGTSSSGDGRAGGLGSQLLPGGWDEKEGEVDVVKPARDSASVSNREAGTWENVATHVVEVDDGRGNVDDEEARREGGGRSGEKNLGGGQGWFQRGVPGADQGLEPQKIVMDVGDCLTAREALLQVTTCSRHFCKGCVCCREYWL